MMMSSESPRDPPPPRGGGGGGGGGGRDVLTSVVVEVARRGAVFDDASTIGSGGDDTQVLDSWVRCQQDDTQEGGAAYYCCPRHPDQRRPYRPHRNSICPECLMESQRDRNSMEDRKRQVEQQLRRLLEGEGGENKIASRGGGGIMIGNCPSGEEDDYDDSHAWLRRNNNSNGVPLVGVAMQDWTKGLRRDAAAAAPRPSGEAKDGEPAGTHRSPPTRPPSSPLYPLKPPPQHTAEHSAGGVPPPAPPATTSTPYPSYPYYYQPSPKDGNPPHPSSELPPLPYPTYASTPTFPPAGAWNPLYHGGAPVPTTATSTPTDAFAAHVHQMMEWQDTMLLHKMRECDELRKSLEDVTNEIQLLQIDNAQLRERVTQQGEQMRHELSAIRREMASRAAAATAVVASTQHVHRTSSSTDRNARDVLDRPRRRRSSSLPEPSVATMRNDYADASMPRSPLLLASSRHMMNVSAAVAPDDKSNDDDDDGSFLGAVRLEPTRWKSSSVTTTTSASSPWFPFPSMDETDCPSSSVALEDGDDVDDNDDIDDPFGVGAVAVVVDAAPDAKGAPTKGKKALTTAATNAAAAAAYSVKRTTRKGSVPGTGAATRAASFSTTGTRPSVGGIDWERNELAV